MKHSAAHLRPVKNHTHIMSEKNQCGNTSVCSGGPIWLIGWLFTIGFIQATFWKAVFAILVWPYFLGSALAVRFLQS